MLRSFVWLLLSGIITFQTSDGLLAFLEFPLNTAPQGKISIGSLLSGNCKAEYHVSSNTSTSMTYSVYVYGVSVNIWINKVQ